MPKCSDCPQTKPSEFNRRRKGTSFQSYCKRCQKQRALKHYKENKNAYLERAKIQRQKMVDLVNSLKNGPCSDCGRSYPPWVMDFDHRPGETKVDRIANLKVNASEQTIRKEATKCDLVCANCHRIRTHQRGQYTAHSITS